VRDLREVNIEATSVVEGALVRLPTGPEIVVLSYDDLLWPRCCGSGYELQSGKAFGPTCHAESGSAGPVVAPKLADTSSMMVERALPSHAFPLQFLRFELCRVRVFSRWRSYEHALPFWWRPCGYELLGSLIQDHVTP
jgi:hypothetical protein